MKHLLYILLLIPSSAFCETKVTGEMTDEKRHIYDVEIELG